MAAPVAPLVVGTGITTVEGSLRLVALAHLALTWFEQAWDVRTTGPADLMVTTARFAGRLRVPPPVSMAAVDASRLTGAALVIDLAEIAPTGPPGCPSLRVPAGASLVHLAALACALVEGTP